MSDATWSRSRAIVRRIEVKGTLALRSPAHFGNGDAEGVTDMPLLRDPLTGAVLLTGASIAGALRNHLWEREMGFGVAPNAKNSGHRKALAVQLFGGIQADPDGIQSALVVDDALGALPETELRDGVTIDGVTRTAADELKFDVELLRAGTAFPLHFELVIGEKDDAHDLRKGLALALDALQAPGEIGLGQRKRRGYGECTVTGWQVRETDLTSGCGLVNWLAGSGTWSSADNDILALLFPQPQDADAVRRTPDAREWFSLHGTFCVESSLLVRSGIGASDVAPDVMHLHRLVAGGDGRTPVLPGTSLAGALRARALRIAQTRHGAKGRRLVDTLFGAPIGDRFTGSRLEVAERPIFGGNTLVQNRLHMDRFTGSVLDNLLFDEAPIFGGPTTKLDVDLRLRAPSRAQIGLVLQVLKDLWNADLPLGGGTNINRGCLYGLEAQLHHRQIHEDQVFDEAWTLTQSWDGRRRGPLQCVGNMQSLESYVTALREWNGEEQDA